MKELPFYEKGKYQIFRKKKNKLSRVPQP